MVPKRILQTWKNYEVPEQWKAYQKTWIENHPDWQYLLTSDDDNREFIASEYPEFLLTYDSLNIPITKVDFVRYLYLHRYGGVYADLDSESVRPLGELIDKYPNAKIYLASPTNSTKFLECALMISEPGHPFWLDLVRDIQKQVHSPSGKMRMCKLFNRSLYILFLTGPFRLSIVYRSTKDKYGDDIQILPPASFYPKKIFSQADNFQSSNAQNNPDCYVIHYFASSWVSDRDRWFVAVLQSRWWWLVGLSVIFIVLVIALVVCIRGEK